MFFKSAFETRVGVRTGAGGVMVLLHMEHPSLQARCPEHSDVRREMEGMGLEKLKFLQLESFPYFNFLFQARALDKLRVCDIFFLQASPVTR